jgi:FkbM family methyltransferase
MKNDRDAKQIDFGWAKVWMTGNPNDSYFANLENFLNGSPSLWHYVGNHLTANSISLDCGANIGATALMMATRCPGGHIYAFEASPINAEYLRHNLELNDIKNVTIVAKPISHRTEKVRFHESVFGAGSHIVTGDRPQKGEVVELDTVVLDDFVARDLKHSNIDFIKLDVEGYEPSALLGAQALIAKFRPSIYLEINAYALALLQRFDPLDFTLFLWDNFEPFSVEHGGNLSPAEDAFSFIGSTMVNKQCVDDVLLVPRPGASFSELRRIVERSSDVKDVELAQATIQDLRHQIAVLESNANKSPAGFFERIMFRRH